MINDKDLDVKIDIENLKSQFEKYMKAEIPVHVVFKIKPGTPKHIAEQYGPRFYNGFIIGKKSEDIYIMDERKIGETYILIDEVFSITVYAQSNNDIIEKVKNKSGFKKGGGVSDDEINLLKDFDQMKKDRKK